MKISFKLLSGITFLLEFSGDTSVGQMKDELEKEKGYARPNTKLIFSGKILDNDNATIDELGIKESNFLVVSVSKTRLPASKKEEPAPVALQPQPVTQAQPTQVVPQSPQVSQPTQPSSQSQPQVAQATPPAQPEPQAQSSPSPQAQAAVGDNNRLVMGEQYQSIIQNFTEMGFPKDQIEKCMRAAFNNPDRAAEYLLSGIPPELEAVANALPRAPQQARPSPPPQQGSQAPPPQQPPQMGGPMSGIPDIIRMIPQFNQLRAAVQANPELLQPLLQRIAQTNPQLFQLINQNPQEFIRMLNEPVSQQPPMPQGGLGANLPNIGLPRTPQQPNQIFIAPQEREAIERLVALGFDQVAAAQAYFAFDKNEELAANFLLEGGGFDDDDDEEGDDLHEGPNQNNQ